jgi:hypothetical protein
VGELVVVTIPGHVIHGRVIEILPTGIYRVAPLASMGPSYPEAIQVSAAWITRMTTQKNAHGTAVEGSGGDEMELIYGRVLRCTMQKTHGRYKGEKFYHDFKPGANSFGLPAGTKIVLPSEKTVTIPYRAIIIKSDRTDLWGHYT